MEKSFALVVLNRRKNKNKSATVICFSNTSSSDVTWTFMSCYCFSPSFPVGFYISIWCLHELLVLFCSLRHQCTSHVLDSAELFLYQFLDMEYERREKENKQFQNWTNKITCPLLCPCEIQNSLPSCRADQKLSQDGTRRTEKCFGDIWLACCGKCNVYIRSLFLKLMESSMWAPCFAH